MRTHLGIEPLEDRLTPAVSPTDLTNALTILGDDTAYLRRVAPLVQTGTNQYTRAAVNAVLPSTTTRLEQAASVLTQYQNQLADEARAGDGNAAALLPRVARQRAAAETAALASASFTLSFGGSATPVEAPRPVGDPLASLAAPGVFFNRTNATGLTNAFPDLTTGFKDFGQGLAVKDIAPGTGEAYTGTGTLKVFYTGFLTDFTRFDGNAGPGATGFPLDLTSGAIAGFNLGLAGLQPGGIRILNIPSELAYGDRANGSIPANSRLIFEVKLVDPSTPTSASTGAATSAGTGLTGLGTTGATDTSGVGSSTSGGASGSGTGVSSGSTGLTGGNTGVGGTTGSGSTGSGTGSTAGATGTGVSGTTGTTTTTGATGADTTAV